MLVALVATARADPAPPIDWNATAPAPSLPSLAAPGTLYLLDASGAVLELTHVHRFTGAVPPWQPLRASYRDAGATCALSWSATESDGVIDLRSGPAAAMPART